MRLYTLEELRSRSDGKPNHSAPMQAYLRALASVRQDLKRIPAWRNGAEDSVCHHCAAANEVVFNSKGASVGHTCISGLGQIGKLAELLIVSDAEYGSDNPIRKACLEETGYDALLIEDWAVFGACYFGTVNIVHNLVYEWEEKRLWQHLEECFRAELEWLGIEPVRYCSCCNHEVDRGWLATGERSCWRCVGSTEPAFDLQRV